MKLKPGDTIRVTKADNVSDNRGASNFNILKALDVEWDGEKFLGCSLDSGGQHPWSLEDMQEYVELSATDPRTRTNIDCMVEQLVGSGAL